MPRHDALHFYRPVIGSYTRRLGVLPLAQASFTLRHPGAGEGRLHTTDDDIVLLVRNPTLPPTRSDKSNPVGRAACLPNNEPVRIYVPPLMHPWIMQACHSAASCHLGTRRTLRMLEWFCWWVGMNVGTRWCLRH